MQLMQFKTKLDVLISIFIRIIRVYIFILLIYAIKLLIITCTFILKLTILITEETKLF